MPPPKPNRPSMPIAQKITVRYAKTGPARWYSHHDMMRFWERAVRRAELPMRRTEGFNPKPRIVFAHALGVGVASRDEWVELELSGARAPADVAERLARAVRPTLELLAVEERPAARKSRTVLGCVYRIDGIPAADADLADAVARMKALRTHEVERGPERERTRVDVRPYLRDAAVAGPGSVRVTLMHTERGAGRVDEWARWLGAAFGADARRFSLTKEQTAFSRE